jgi:hypothetical protein
LTGDSFLVGPLLNVSRNPTTTKSLVTVSVAVLLFVLLLSFEIRLSNVETLVATATYAAVLCCGACCVCRGEQWKCEDQEANVALSSESQMSS